LLIASINVIIYTIRNSKLGLAERRYDIMPLPQENIYTIEDIYALPDDKRAELIDGEMYMMAPPSTTHQRISRILNIQIDAYIQKNNSPCEVFAAPFAVFLNNDMRTYVEPDISVICDKDKLDDQGCHGAPDWIIEIVSPSSKKTDYFIKMFKYRTAGVREYWIIDPISNSVLVYSFEKDIWADHYDFSDKVKVNIYEDLYLDFSGIKI